MIALSSEALVLHSPAGSATAPLATGAALPLARRPGHPSRRPPPPRGSAAQLVAQPATSAAAAAITACNTVRRGFVVRFIVVFPSVGNAGHTPYLAACEDFK
jgi:hypothetical protein